MKRVILILLLLICEISFAQQKETLMFEFNRSACYGACPDDNLKIYRNGKVIYTGRHDVKRIGMYEMEISKITLDSLIKLFVDSCFFDLKNYFDNTFDIPTYTIRFAYKQKQNKIFIMTNHEPAVIKELTKQLEKIINLEGWQKFQPIFVLKNLSKNGGYRFRLEIDTCQKVRYWNKTKLYEKKINKIKIDSLIKRFLDVNFLDSTNYYLPISVLTVKDSTNWQKDLYELYFESQKRHKAITFYLSNKQTSFIQTILKEFENIKSSGKWENVYETNSWSLP